MDLRQTHKLDLTRAMTLAAAITLSGAVLAGPQKGGKAKKAPPPQIDTSQCYAEAIVDGETNKLVAEHSRNAREPVLTASTGKLMPALLYADQVKIGTINPNDNITFYKPHKRGDYCDGVTAENGKAVTMSGHNTLRAALIISDNDAARAIAKEVERVTRKPYTQLAAEKAKVLHLDGTSLVSPSGISDSQTCSGISEKNPIKVAEKLSKGEIKKAGLNISTAEDMAHLLLAVSKVPMLHDIMQEKSFDGYGGTPIPATNKLLAQSPDAIGKTGTTRVAGQAFVGKIDTYGVAVMHCIGATPEPEMKKTTPARWAFFDRARGWLKSAFSRQAKPEAPLSAALAAPAPSAPDVPAAVSSGAAPAEKPASIPKLDTSAKIPDIQVVVEQPVPSK